MKKLFLIIAGLLAMRAGAQTTITDSFLHDGIYRSYILYVPASYTAGSNTPLIINMHGLGSNATEQFLYSNFAPIADTAGFIFVCPNGTSYFGSQFWNAGFSGFPPVDDIGFISALIDSLSAHYTIDSNRVYSTGMSNGGYMSHYLALNLSNRITAIASVAGSMTPEVYPIATAPQVIPMMQIHGTADSTVAYAGGPICIPVDTLVKFWVTEDGCNPVADFTMVPDIDVTDGCTAEHYVYPDGTNGATCEFYKVIGGAHTWPGALFLGLTTNEDFSASKEIWRFFSQYSKDQFLGVANNSLQACNLRIAPNPVPDQFRIDGIEKIPGAKTILVYSMDGRLLETIYLSANKEAIVPSAVLPSGIYSIVVKTSEGTIALKAIR